MTGWGQDGPRSQQAGHDINYISLNGLLHAIGRAGERPVPPLNLAGDFGGGSMFLIVGILVGAVGAADLRQGPGGRRRDDRRLQRADGDDVGVPRRRACGPTSAASTCSTPARRTTTPTSAPTAATSSVGAIEPQFYAELLKGLGLDGEDLPAQHDVSRWPELRARFTEVFASARTATTGPRCSPAPTPARRRCCRSPRCRPKPHITERDTFYLDGDVPAAVTRAAVLPQRAAHARSRWECRATDIEAVLRDWNIEKGTHPVEIKDAVAVVTGGASGLGLATTKRLLDAGAQVVVHRHQG